MIHVNLGMLTQLPARVHPTPARPDGWPWGRWKVQRAGGPEGYGLAWIAMHIDAGIGLPARTWAEAMQIALGGPLSAGRATWAEVATEVDRARFITDLAAASEAMARLDHNTTTTRMEPTA